MGNYQYNPCSPCCINCGWGPFQFTSAADDPFTNQFQQTDFNGTPTWSISAFRLTMVNGSGSLWRSSVNPDPTGKAASGHLWTSGAATIQAKCWKSNSTSQAGVFIGGGRVFYADWAQGTFFHSSCDAHGNANRPPVQVPGAPVDGNVLSICIQRIPSGSFNIAYSINGSVTATEIGVPIPPLTTGSTFNSGFWGTQAAQVGLSSVVCGTSCPTTDSCTACPGGTIAPCWGLNVTGISVNQFNGNFCLRAAGCTLTDQNSLWTVTVRPSNSTLIAATGSTTFATYKQTGSFNCIGPNSFTLVSATSGTGWPTTINIGPTNCAAPPCVAITNCGQCSWPTHWTVTIGGLASSAKCQTFSVAHPLGGLVPPVPPENPDSVCFHQLQWTGANGNFQRVGNLAAVLASPLVPGCDALNGTYTLVGPGPPPLFGAKGWTYQGNQNICLNGGNAARFNAPNPVLPFLNLTCADVSPGGFIQAGNGWTFTAPGPGMYFFLGVEGCALNWSSLDAQPVYLGDWVGESVVYLIPYYCPFNQITCFQPITLNQLPLAQHTAFPAPDCCQGWPATVTVTPA
jgi:hypothetical protein